MINALCAQALPPTPASPVVLMVSGGSDSTALLVRAVADGLDLADGAGARRLEASRLHVLHVNHCLRGEDSDGDETFVRELAARLGVACTVRRVDVAALAARHGANVEETARQVRYAAAWELAGDLASAADVPRESARVLVAHTADDRAETFLMRALTGAGAGGFTGMRRVRGIVVRPLLGETRAALREYLAARGIGWREDATNAEDDHLRSYVRNRAVPVFAARNPAFAHTLSRSLDVLAEEDALLGRLAACELGRLELPVASRAEGVRLDAPGLVACEPALARRALRLALVRAYGEKAWECARLEARHVEALLALARAGAGSCTLPLGLDARVSQGVLCLRMPPEPGTLGLQDAALPVPGELAWAGGVLRARLVEVPPDVDDACAWARGFSRARCAELGLAQGRSYVLADLAALRVRACGRTALSVGAPRPGERMHPFGMAGSKLVSDVLREGGVPAPDRARVPVVRARRADGTEACVWVGGNRLDARAAYGPQTRALVELSFMCE